jgi:hypothetical protein
MVKYVFIFGAGASKDEGLPLQNKLLQTYFDSGLDDELRGNLKQYFEDFYDIDFRNINNANFPTFEESLGVIELSIENEEIYSQTYNLEKLRVIRNYLVLSMGLAIQNSPLNLMDSHNRLIKRLFRRGHFKQGEYSFISLNYDILLDKALMNILESNIYVDYGVAFTNEDKRWAKDPFEKWESPINKQHVVFLKPHGSFNWMCCPKCNSIYIKGQSKSGFFEQGYLYKIENCPKDECALNCIIEPPSYFKNFKNIYIQNIWKKAFEILSDADIIIFIGYSMPEADIWFKYLLKKCCYKNSKKFIVINPNPMKDMIQRYERLLGPVIYYQTKFLNFSKNHIPYLNCERISDIPCNIPPSEVKNS